jgi:8-oxo-dGTP diphosphatase
MKLIPGKDFIGIGVFALILNHKNQVLLIKKQGKDYWERPGGKVEFGEKTIDALKREVLEETNVKILVKELMYINELIDSKSHWIGFHYIAKYITGTTKILEPKKHADIGWFNLDSLPKLSPVSTNILKIYKKSLKNY